MAEATEKDVDVKRKGGGSEKKTIQTWRYRHGEMIGEKGKRCLHL